jgi:Uma2 family endonuclease
VTVHGQPSTASPDDLLALKRQAPDYVPPPPSPVSWEELLTWADEDTHAEWVDGAIIEMPPVIDDHQFILGFIYRLPMDAVEARQLGRAYLAPFKMRLRARPSGREPDLLFLSTEHIDRATPTYLDGPADMVLEVVSPESIDRDYRVKLAEYEAAGIPEYWIVNPMRREARFYELGADGRYHPGRVSEDGIYTSPTVPGFRMRVSWLWQRPIPILVAALADLPG